MTVPSSLPARLAEPFLKVWRETDRECLPGAGRYPWRMASLALSAGVLLTLNHQFATRQAYGALAVRLGLDPGSALGVYLYWDLFLLLTMVAAPLWISRRFYGLGPRDLGLGLGLTWGSLRIYALLYGLNLPFIAWACRMPAFVEYYPFYKAAGSSVWMFLLWEAVYAVQFACVEFFYRGFLVHAGKQAMGAGAVAFMALPYCMLHFPKPFPEPFIALAMGFVLGVLSLKTRSIWGGAALHVSVAVTMDVLALASRPENIFHAPWLGLP